MPTKAEKIERYTQLIRVMESLDEHARARHFNMKEWGAETECGTTMCAAGFAAHDPWFNAQGFTYDKEKRTLNYWVNYELYVSWSALFAFFGREPPDRAWNHPIFHEPKTVDEVTFATRERIKQLSAQPDVNVQ